MQKGEFRLRKWKSNDPVVLNKINEVEGTIEAKEGDWIESSFAKETLGLSNNNGEKTKVLGIVWDTKRTPLSLN